MLSPTVLVLGAVFSALFVLQEIHHRIQRRRNANEWGCKPAPVAPTGFYGIPAFLQLAQAAKEKRWVEYIAARYDEYGYTFSQKMLGRVAISTIEPENLKALLSSQFEDFCLGTRHREFYPTLGDGIFTLDGAGWSHSRALLRPQFNRDQVYIITLFVLVSR
jgi:hypothetical protein